MQHTGRMQSLFDIQVNGFAGVDFQQADLSGEDLQRAVEGLARHQTLRFFATLITDSPERLEAKFRRLEDLRRQDATCRQAICGYHLEGPWLSPEPGYRGAHDPAWMGPPDLDTFTRLQEAAGGHIRLLTLAPEQAGSAAFIRRVVDVGVEVSIGHSNASDDVIEAAIEAGARFCTHLGNGVPQDLHRHENIIQRLLARDELTAFFIPDGIHLPPSVLRNFVRSKPEGKALFTTDCMAAAGAPPGRYRVAHHEIEVGTDRIVRQPGQSGFAGSALEPDRGVENLGQWLGYDPTLARRRFSSDIARLFDLSLPECPTKCRTS